MLVTLPIQLSPSKIFLGTCPVVTWLQPRASIAGGEGLISGQETKILHAAQCSQEKTKKNVSRPYQASRMGQNCSQLRSNAGKLADIWGSARPSYQHTCAQDGLREL